MAIDDTRAGGASGGSSAKDDARVDAREKYRRLKVAYEELERRSAALQDSYYLSGARKKIDVAGIPVFGDIASQVRAEGRAGMQLDRLYTLWQAVFRAPAGLPIVEVGTYLGGSAKFIAESFRARGQAPHFYVCDTFRGHARTDDVLDPLPHREGGKFQNTSPESVRAYLAAYPHVQLVVGDIFDTAPQQLSDETAFGLVHIDVDVYPPTDFCLRFFAPRLARGAWMVVDDYGFITCPGAKQAVDDFVASNPDFSMLHLLSGQAVLFRAA